MHLFETEPGSQHTSFRITHPAKYDPVSALYQKRGSKVHHWKHHQLFLRFRKAACSSRNLPGIGNRTGFVLRIPSFSGRKSGPIVKASDFRQRLLLFLFILHFFELEQHNVCFSESIPPVPFRCAINRQYKMEKCGNILTYM